MSDPRPPAWYRALSRTSRARVAVPANVGAGCVRRMVTGCGATVARWEVTFAEPLAACAPSGDVVSLFACRRSPLAWEVVGRPGVVATRRGTACLYRTRGEPESIRYEADVPYAFDGVQVPAGRFARLVGANLEPADASRAMRLVDGPAPSLALTPRMVRLLDELCGGPYAAQAIEGCTVCDARVVATGAGASMVGGLAGFAGAGDAGAPASIADCRVEGVLVVVADDAANVGGTALLDRAHATPFARMFDILHMMARREPRRAAIPVARWPP